MANEKEPGAPLSMADRDGFIWQDGKLVPWREATTHVLTHSLHYGLAVFEGVRAYKTAIGTAIYRLKEHTDRLFNSAHIYMMKIPFSRAELMEAQLQVVRENGHEACYVRPIAFYGSEKMGVAARGNTARSRYCSRSDPRRSASSSSHLRFATTTRRTRSGWAATASST